MAMRTISGIATEDMNVGQIAIGDRESKIRLVRDTDHLGAPGEKGAVFMNAKRGVTAHIVTSSEVVIGVYREEPWVIGACEP